MSMSYFLSFDVGTTSMKCLLFDEKFNEVFFEEREYKLFTPQKNIVELNPDIYYHTLCECVKNLLSSGIDKEDIKSITMTTQGETLIPIDENGNALRNAIVWIDARAEKESEYINSKIDVDAFYRKTGLGEINGALPSAKLLWIYKNEPQIYKSTYKFLLLEDFLIYKLTGMAVTEPSLLSSTGYYDIVNETYFDEMLSICSVEKGKLPDIVPCGTKVGTLTEKAVVETGLSKNTVVVTGAMDQVSSAIGAGNIESGIVTETTGTALVVGVTAEKPDFNNPSKITIYKHFDHNFLYMPYTNTAGIVLKWFRDTFLSDLKKRAKEQGVSAYKLIDELAQSSPAGSNGIVTLPHFAGKTGIERAKGVIYGINLSTALSDIVRSVLESIGCMLFELISEIEKMGVDVCEIRSLGGGGASDIWCEIKAGITSKKIMRTTYVQTTALGAAILGSVAIGTYDTVKDALCVASLKYDEFLPKSEDVSLYKQTYDKYKELYDALKIVF